MGGRERYQAINLGGSEHDGAGRGTCDAWHCRWEAEVRAVRLQDSEDASEVAQSGVPGVRREPG